MCLFHRVLMYQRRCILPSTMSSSSTASLLGAPPPPTAEISSALKMQFGKGVPSPSRGGVIGADYSGNSYGNPQRQQNYEKLLPRGDPRQHEPLPVSFPSPLMPCGPPKITTIIAAIRSLIDPWSRYHHQHHFYFHYNNSRRHNHHKRNQQTQSPGAAHIPSS